MGCFSERSGVGYLFFVKGGAGESVSAGKPLFKLADLSRVYVRAYFTTAQLSGLIGPDGAGKPGEICTSYPDRLLAVSGEKIFDLLLCPKGVNVVKSCLLTLGSVCTFFAVKSYRKTE